MLRLGIRNFRYQKHLQLNVNFRIALSITKHKSGSDFDSADNLLLPWMGRVQQRFYESLVAHGERRAGEDAAQG